jgi:alkanesulfonate monooxygenase SsuD/methylene tetrahydromethanopterin reductase-like flavin-dependent oxidoreductase (luciferase family)
MEFGIGYFPTYDGVGPGELARLTTSRLRVGSGICLLIERDPIITAKEVASIDHLSGGRFEFGVGAGWNREEMANHGTDPRTRMRRLQESVEAMKAIWTEDEASYEGKFVSFERIWCWPKPQQQPYPLVLAIDAGARRALHWLPSAPFGVVEPALERWERAIAEVNGAA